MQSKSLRSTQQIGPIGGNYQRIGQVVNHGLSVSALVTSSRVVSGVLGRGKCTLAKRTRNGGYKKCGLSWVSSASCTPTAFDVEV